MATITIKNTTLNIESIYVTVKCPNCLRSSNYHMKRPVTNKLCQRCNRVSYEFCIIPRGNLVSITCHAIGNGIDDMIDIKSTDVEIVEQ